MGGGRGFDLLLLVVVVESRIPEANSEEIVAVSMMEVV